MDKVIIGSLDPSRRYEDLNGRELPLSTGTVVLRFLDLREGSFLKIGPVRFLLWLNADGRLILSMPSCTEDRRWARQIEFQSAELSESTSLHDLLGLLRTFLDPFAE